MPMVRVTENGVEVHLGVIGDVSSCLRELDLCVSQGLIEDGVTEWKHSEIAGLVLSSVSLFLGVCGIGHLLREALFGQRLGSFEYLSEGGHDFSTGWIGLLYKLKEETSIDQVCNVAFSPG